MWTCPKCQTKVDPAFDVCWNCGTTADGVEDPTFVKADDQGPIAGDPVSPELDVKDEDAIPGELPEPIHGDLVEAYNALDLMEATFLTNQLKADGIPAICDKYDMHDTLGTMEGDPKIWVRADDLPRARAWLEAYDASKTPIAGD